MVNPPTTRCNGAVARPPSDRKAWAALYQKAARLADENLLSSARAPATRGSLMEQGTRRGSDASAAVAATALLGLRSTGPTT